MVLPPWKTICQVFKKVSIDKHRMTIGLSHSPSSYVLKRAEIIISVTSKQRNGHNVHSSIIHSSNEWKWPQCPDKQNVVHPCHGITFSHEKGWSSDICRYNLDSSMLSGRSKSQKPHAGWCHTRNAQDSQVHRGRKQELGEQGTTVHDEGGVCFWGDENAMQLEGCDDHTVCCECAENPLSHYFFCCVSHTSGADSHAQTHTPVAAAQDIVVTWPCPPNWNCSISASTQDWWRWGEMGKFPKSKAEKRRPNSNFQSGKPKVCMPLGGLRVTCCTSQLHLQRVTL